MDKETPISNADFSAGMNELVNKWFKRWRDHYPMTDDDWHACIVEETEITRKYPYEVIGRIGVDLVEELERRDKQHE